MTVAPTIPVLAASSMPTTMTAMANPPRRPPNIRLNESSRSSAMRARSRVTPMNTNSGTATSVSLLMIPNSRLGMAPRKRYVEHTDQGAPQGEQQRGAAQRESNRKARQQHAHDADEHQERGPVHLHPRPGVAGSEGILPSARAGTPSLQPV